MKAIPRQKTILVVDDDPATLDVISDLLENQGFQVIRASDGASALKLWTPKIDLVVLDIMMPKIDGLKVCKAIREREGGDRTAILILTARAETEEITEGLSVGADDYLTKPFHYQEFLARVKSLLRIRELNVALLEAQKKVVEQEKKLALSKLTATTAHELGQPVSAIILNCHLLKKINKGDLSFQEIVSAIEEDIHKIAKFIEQVREINLDKGIEYFKEIEMVSIDNDKDNFEKE